MEDMDYCSICTRKETNGIKINKKMICSDCEGELLKTSPTDPQYDKYLHKIKTILFSEVKYN